MIEWEFFLAVAKEINEALNASGGSMPLVQFYRQLGARFDQLGLDKGKAQIIVMSMVDQGALEIVGEDIHIRDVPQAADAGTGSEQG